MALEGGGVVEAAEARAEHRRADERGPTAGHVHDAGAGEVNHAAQHVVLVERRQEAVAVPDPVDDHGVDEAGDAKRVDQVGLPGRGGEGCQWGERGVDEAAPVLLRLRAARAEAAPALLRLRAARAEEVEARPMRAGSLSRTCSWQRSATAPETMVAAAAAKAYWKNHVIQS